MRTILVLALICISYSLNAQSLSGKDIRILNTLQVKTDSLNLNDLSIQKDLKKILCLDRKRKTNQVVAIVITSFAALGIVSGTVLASGDNTIIGEVVGGSVILGGVIYGGISIPFWTASSRRKRERDRLIKLFD
ncbi:hypothetical protein [Tenacibaculum sp. 190524A02b]|uniref:Superfamily III holin-X n=1 Tax=Tenacibaculum vairaonense TaxID=3137860 RepID=A0ABM9PRM8_9FLAO